MRGSRIRRWAHAMTWAHRQGMFTGKNAHTLDPTGTTTRAETAVILECLPAAA